MFALWISPIRWTVRVGIASVTGVIVFRLGAWLLLSSPAGDIRTLAEMRTELRYAIAVDGTGMFTLLGALVLFARAPGWCQRFFEVMRELSDYGRAVRLPVWPVQVRWLSVSIVGGMLGLTVAAVLDVGYALLRDVGLTSIDQHGVSAVAFWALYLWTTGLWALFGGCYLHAWVVGRTKEIAQAHKVRKLT